MSTVTRYRAEEIARLGNEIYERDIRPLVEAGNEGRTVAIDVRTGDYELADDELASGDRLRARLPEAEIWFVPIGHSAVHHLPRAETQQRFEQEEQSYWRQRDELLRQYAGKWVAIVGGQVAAVGEQMNKVAAEAWRKTGSGLMYVNLVGGEDVALRVRQVVSGHYDRTYAPPMPMVTAAVGDLHMSASAEVTFVVDTGADLTVLRSEVADQVELWGDIAGRHPVGGVGGAPEMRQLYNALVQVGGQSFLVTVDCRDDIGEDILGRDVINEFALTVCAKRDQVEFEWVEDTET
jgi:predicted aspartyl protease